MKNYTNLSEKKIDNLTPQFSKATEVVDSTTFEENKDELWEGYKVSANADMLKFRYYTPEDNLIEQENVPILKDGRSVDNVEEYYCRTSSSITPDYNSEGVTWLKDEIPDFTGDNPYLWNYEITYFDKYDESGSKMFQRTPVCLLDKSGKQIKSITEYYAVNNDPNNPPSSWLTTAPKVDTEHRYLWNYEVIKFEGLNDSYNHETSPVIIGVCGENGDDASTIYISTNAQTVVRKESGTYSHSSVTFSFFKKEGLNDPVQTSFYYKVFIDDKSTPTYSGNGSSVVVPTQNIQTNIVCNIYKDESSNTPLDTESVEILNDGTSNIVISFDPDNIILSTSSDNKILNSENIVINYKIWQGSYDITSSATVTRPAYSTFFQSVNLATNGLIIGTTTKDKTMSADVYTEEFSFKFRLRDGTEKTVSKSLTITKAAKGEQGVQGGGYLGTCTSVPYDTQYNNGDFLLDTANQVIYYKENGKWKSDSTLISWRWNACMEDCIAAADKSGNILTAANAWISKLLVNTAFINKLFAKVITLKNPDGIIQSEIYNELEGFQIKANGEATFCHGVTLKGSIDNYIIKAAPASLEAFSYKGTIPKCHCATCIRIITDTSGYNYYDYSVKYVNSSYEVNIDSYIISSYVTTPSYIDIGGGFNYVYPIDYEIEISGYEFSTSGHRNKLFFIDLPSSKDTEETLEKNQVYIDNNGYLRIYGY